MSEKNVSKVKMFGDAWKRGADKLSHARKNIKQWQVPDTVKREDIKDLETFLTWVKENAQKMTSVSAPVLLQMMEYTMRMLNLLGVDNPLLRDLELRFGKIKNTHSAEDKFIKNVFEKVKRVTKEHNVLASYLVYYAVFLSALFAVTPRGQEKVEDKENDVNAKTEIKHVVKTSDVNEKKQSAQSHTYGGFLERTNPITPLLIADLVAMEGAVVNEDGLCVVYDDATMKPLKPGQKPIGNATIGFGSTVLENGERVTSNTKPISLQRAYDLAKWHIENKETFFFMYCYDVYLNKKLLDNTDRAIGLASVFYNSCTNLIEDSGDKNHRTRNELLRKLYKTHGMQCSDSAVMEIFKKYPIVAPKTFGKNLLIDKSVTAAANSLGLYVRDGNGLRWRRWLEAGLLTGDISAELLLMCPVGAIPEFYHIHGKDAFFEKNEDKRRANKQLYKEFEKWVKNPVDRRGFSLAKKKKVIDLLPDFAAEQCEAGKCKLNDDEMSNAFFDLLSEIRHHDKEKNTQKFNRGIQNIRKKNARSDLLLYGTVKSVENNA